MEYERFGMTLVLLSRLYRRELDQALRAHGLSEAMAQPIRYLARMGDGTRQGELATAMNLEGPSLVRVLDQLAAAGLVERVEAQDDRRARLVRLTGAGRALHAELRAKLEPLRREIFAGIAEAELEGAMRVMESLITRLECLHQKSQIRD